MSTTGFSVLLLGTCSLWAASPGYTLPDPLKKADGTSITAEGWRKYRRAEVLGLFEQHVYGRSPARPKQMQFKVVEEDREALAGKAIRREVNVIVGGDASKTFTFRVTLYLPKSASKPVPVFLLLNHRGTVASQVGNPFFPVEQIVSRGYGAAGITTGQLAPDNAKTYRDGVIGFYDGADAASPDSWKTIAAWAWGGQRAMDYLQTDKNVDGKRVAVVGHSRGGKAALWCGAQDQRFALTISNNSGETGAALARQRKGESLKQANDVFPHWFAESYKGYNDREDALPVDQHELISLIAPRLVYVASAETDAWADPEGEFLSCVHATPVFQILGVDGIGALKPPPLEQPIHTGRIGYHIRKGGHGLTGYDWDQFMTFADRHMTR